MAERLFESYLGDGLYVYHDGYHVWLYTSDGASAPDLAAAVDRVGWEGR